MSFRYMRLVLAFGFICPLAVIAQTPANHAPTEAKVAFYQGGEYPWHAVLREVIQVEATRLLPDTIQFTFPPTGFATAGWDRDSSKVLAKNLTASDDIDLIVAMGPWTVEDLIEANCSKPIIALHRFDPVLEGLVDSTGRPIRDNLTVNMIPDKYQSDLTALTSLVNVKRLGLLVFPSNDEKSALVRLFGELGERFGFEVVSAEGFSPRGAFAFFKAYQNLERENLDALYISPLWGLNSDMMTEFLRTARRDRIPVFSAEGRYHVTRGALASARGQTAAGDGYFSVWKMAQILQGKTPADLPVILPGATTLTINEATARLLNIPISEFMAASAEIIPVQRAVDAELFDLPVAIAQSLAAYPGYLAGYDAIEAAEYAARAAASDYWPRLMLDASAGYVDDHTVHNSFDELSNEQLEARLSVEQRLFSMQTIRQIKAARQRVDIEQADFQQAGLDLERAVTAAYLDHLAARDRLNVETEARLIIDRYLERALAAAEAGSGLQGQAARWRSARHEAVRRIAQARADVHITQTIFNILLNRPPLANVELDPQNFDAARFVTDYYALQSAVGTRQARDRSADRLIDQAAESNAELERATRRLTLQSTLGDINSARWWPTIGFRAGFGLQDRLENRIGFSEETTTWSVGARLHWPLFMGGERNRTAAQLRAEYSRLDFERERVKLQVLANIHNQLRRLVATLAGGAAAALAAEEAADYVQIFGNARQTSIGDQLDAVAQFRETHLAAVERRYAYHRVCADLARTVGWSLFERNATPSIVLVDFLTSGHGN